MSERASLQHNQGEWGGGLGGLILIVPSLTLGLRRVDSPSQEPLSRPEAAWKPFGLVGSRECQPL